MTERHVHRLDAGAVRAWAELTGDTNPLHLDETFAAGTRFGRPIVHGHLLAALVVDALGEAADGAHVRVRFSAPVPVGSDVVVERHGDAAPVVTVDGGRPVEVTVETR